MINISEWYLIGIGIGGIANGWLPAISYYYVTKVLPFKLITLVDGKTYRPANRSRQHYLRLQNKAVEQCSLWRNHYPTLPLRFHPEFVTQENIAHLVPEQSAVLLSPDNLATRRLVSDHVETLQNALLINGGNSVIDKERQKDGTEGAVMVHFKLDGVDLTPPLTRHHKNIAHPPDVLPTKVGCTELAQTYTQLAMTNYDVGTTMAYMLRRYCTRPPKEATEAVERWFSSKTGQHLDYGPTERPVT